MLVRSNADHVDYPFRSGSRRTSSFKCNTSSCEWGDIGAKLGFSVIKKAWEAIPFDYLQACTIHSQLSFQLYMRYTTLLFTVLLCKTLLQTARNNEIVSKGYRLLEPLDATVNRLLMTEGISQLYKSV